MRRLMFLPLMVAFAFVVSLQQLAHAGSVLVAGNNPGATPFHASVDAYIQNGSLQSVSFSIANSGSIARPLAATYSLNYLTRYGFLQGNHVSIPVFGLLNVISKDSSALTASPNTVGLTFRFADGSVQTALTEVRTPGYSDSCATVNNLGKKVASPGPSNSPLSVQARQSTNDLSYDFFLLKDYCSSSSPIIVDTDGNIRWVPVKNQGTCGPASLITSNGQFIISVGLANYPLCQSQRPGLQAMNIQNGFVGKLPVVFPSKYTVVGDHNIDYGRNGTYVVGVGNAAQQLSTLVETDGYKILNEWDFTAIVHDAMQYGYDNPCKLIDITTAPKPGFYDYGYCDADPDWFHENSSVYDPVNNLMIVSSRENFVMAVDYDPPSDGSQRKIRWIFGDTSKLWYTFPSLRKYALSYNMASCPPIGQHSLSLDAGGNLLMMNDGLNSARTAISPNPNLPGVDYHSPPKQLMSQMQTCDTNVSAFKIDLTQHPNGAPGVATIVGLYSNQGPGTKFINPFCGSAYSYHSATDSSILVDFPLQAAGTPPPSQAAGVPSSPFTQIQGLRRDGALVFDLKLPSALEANNTLGCGTGWNAVPTDLSNLYYDQ